MGHLFKLEKFIHWALLSQSFSSNRTYTERLPASASLAMEAEEH